MEELKRKNVSVHTFQAQTSSEGHKNNGGINSYEGTQIKLWLSKYSD